jgi:hypothetical protein
MQVNRENEKVVTSLREYLKGCKSVLDIGCGQSSMLQYIPWITESLGVEIWQPYIDESKQYHIHTHYIQSDVTKFKPTRNYDAVMCIDVLEHISKDKSEKLLDNMIGWADKKIIIYVPNGYLSQGDPYNDGNEYQHHLSEWSVNDFTKRGFIVSGFSGFKYLRGESGDICIKTPGYARDIYQIVSKMSESFCRVHPKYAFALLAIYTK